MNNRFANQLGLPYRVQKPRRHGITVGLDNGYSAGLFEDCIRSNLSLIDYVKFGWGTALVTERLKDKVDVLRALGVGYLFGGTLFEIFAAKDALDAFLDLCATYQCTAVEVSSGSLPIGIELTESCIRDFKKAGLTVFCEVGLKDTERSISMGPNDWIEQIKAADTAGADYIVLETRESGSSGICGRDGEILVDLVNEIIDCGVPVQKLVFEAPRKLIQTFFVRRVGANVNLANIPLVDLISVETLRQRLRFDSLVEH